MKINSYQNRIVDDDVSRYGVPLPENETKKILKSLGLNASGAAAVETALDPFHDYDVSGNMGWPDGNPSKSIVMTYTRQTLVGSIGANSQMSICFSPLTIPVQFIRTSIAGGIRLNGTYTSSTYLPNVGLTSASTASGWGGLSIIQGTSQNLTPSTYNGSTVTIGMLNPFASSYETPGENNISTQGAYRVIGAAFEVHDLTPPLYQTGSVTVWRFADGIEQHNVVYHKTNGNGGVTPVRQQLPTTLLRNPPATLEEAVSIPGSLTWSAKDGCYVVAPLALDRMAPQRVVEQAVMITSEDSSYSVTEAVATNPLVWGDASNLSNYVCTNIAHIGSITSCGAFFSGLAAESTFRVTAKWILEYYPVVAETTLIPLISNPCPYDPAALHFYTHAIQTLPFGTAVGNNAHGAWWKQVLKNMLSGAKIASSLAAFHPDPRVQLMGAGAGMAIEGGNQMYRAAKPNKKQKAKRTK